MLTHRQDTWQKVAERVWFTVNKTSSVVCRPKGQYGEGGKEMTAVIDRKNVNFDGCSDNALRFAYGAFGDVCAVVGADGVSPDGSLCIPEYAPDGRRVVAIADSAFEGMEQLVHVSIPAGVKTIGKRAFAFCTSLVSVEFDECSALVSIAARAFCGCDNLTDIVLPGTVSFCGEKAFAYCSRLASVRLPEALTVVSTGMFEGCRRLESVQLSVGLRAIGKSAFSACVSLRGIVLPASVQSIDDSAFMWCEHLSGVTLKNPECEISPYAFFNAAEPTFRFAV